MTIARKEARETHYWLRLIRDSKMIPASRIEPLIQEALELAKIFPKLSQPPAKTWLNRQGKLCTMHYAL
jgi:four helix bundle protein